MLQNVLTCSSGLAPRGALEKVRLLHHLLDAELMSIVMALGLLYKTVAVVFANFRVECVDSEKDVVGVAFFPVKWKNARIRLIPI